MTELFYYAYNKKRRLQDLFSSVMFLKYQDARDTKFPIMIVESRQAGTVIFLRRGSEQNTGNFWFIQGDCDDDDDDDDEGNLAYVVDSA